MNIEQEIVAKGLIAPRITLVDIEKNIVSEHYFTASQGAHAAISELAFREYNESPIKADGPLDLLTFCVLILKNGFTVTGESACASPENFNAEIGQKVARGNAVDKIWPLMGYELKSRLSNS